MGYWVEFQDARHGSVQKATIVRDDDDGAGPLEMTRILTALAPLTYAAPARKKEVAMS
jgi:hypothetical protein